MLQLCFCWLSINTHEILEESRCMIHYVSSYVSFPVLRHCNFLELRNGSSNWSNSLYFRASFMQKGSKVIQLGEAGLPACKQQTVEEIPKLCCATNCQWCFYWSELTISGAKLIDIQLNLSKKMLKRRSMNPSDFCSSLNAFTCFIQKPPVVILYTK